MRGLFARFTAARGDDDPNAMRELASLAFDELDVHTALEETIFYPAVSKLDSELGEEIDEGLQEHHVADVLITEARPLTPGCDEWIAKLTVIIESVEHHIGEEESDLFPKRCARPATPTRGGSGVSGWSR